ncbi:hypothetical protein FEM48_Zijuj02G0091400 [Ziziphus jujuba var. spinosa]|uniref:Protein transport protein Sec61 subunit beta n=2 Tax=Ziziphus jujuba TaxID=326968 RepID=A0A978VUV6_ZIZJJ|nr:hypothetical protein FEM48_Zijuj02G0091400 [Ziziphus jujuba var. spinosa]
MARGSSSQSQPASSSTSRPGVMAPRGSAAATAGMRRRRLGGGNTSSSGGISGGSGPGSNMLRFYTDDAPGLKISPTVVLVMSLCFIGFVTALHVFGKFYRYRYAGGAQRILANTVLKTGEERSKVARKARPVGFYGEVKKERKVSRACWDSNSSGTSLEALRIRPQSALAGRGFAFGFGCVEWLPVSVCGICIDTLAFEWRVAELWGEQYGYLGKPNSALPV